MRVVEILKDMQDLAKRKNKTYGDSYDKAGKILDILYPNGPTGLSTVLYFLIVQIVHKLSRVSQTKGMSLIDSLIDLSMYSILAIVQVEKETGSSFKVFGWKAFFKGVFPKPKI